uniref:tRNA nucleotidyltransferase/poly(A) polymerase RNA and SrmB- binding domain-containing protein n=1 Tax=Anopheles coluzzii TaxID=1518534 RepID=A0A8W7PRU6_ANOCL
MVAIRQQQALLKRFLHINGFLCRYSSTNTERFKQFIEQRRMDARAIARPDPVVKKIDSPEFRSIFTQELKDLIALFERYNFEIRVAGGAVRDILMNMNPKDIFTKENIRMVNMNGEKHGTITPRINDRENFEITTLRIDAITDGRHAEVIHTPTGFDGTLYDYFYGYEDLQKRRVAFVGDPDMRIKEDYLRILRYFRFYGRIAEESNRHDEETLRIITKNADGLARISGERIWQEWKKILSGNFGIELTEVMINCQLAPHMGLPDAPNVPEFLRVAKQVRSFDPKLQPITVLSALLNTPEDAVNLNMRLKFTVYERELCYFITQNREETATIDELLPFQQLCLQTISSVKLKKEYVLELLKYHGKRELYQQLLDWPIPQFPIKGNVLIANGAPKGPKLGEVLDRLKIIWSNNQYNMTQEQLLEHLPAVLEEINVKKK